MIIHFDDHTLFCCVQMSVTSSHVQVEPADRMVLVDWYQALGSVDREI
jgi:hypothetical protein